MCRDLVAPPAGNALERLLERRVLERLDFPAIAADEVVVMVAARIHALEACDPVSEVDTLDQTELVEALERAIDAGDPDPWPARADPVVNLLRGQTAVLPA